MDEDVDVAAGSGTKGKKEVTDLVNILRATRSGVIWIAGMLNRHEVIQLLSHATAFVCPSLYEPLGIVNLEAMACGTAVVASNVGGIPEVVADGQTGLLVPPDEPEALANVLNTLARDPERRQAPCSVRYMPRHIPVHPNEKHDRHRHRGYPLQGEDYPAFVGTGNKNKNQRCINNAATQVHNRRKAHLLHAQEIPDWLNPVCKGDNEGPPEVNRFIAKRRYREKTYYRYRGQQQEQQRIGAHDAGDNFRPAFHRIASAGNLASG